MDGAQNAIIGGYSFALSVTSAAAGASASGMILSNFSFFRLTNRMKKRWEFALLLFLLASLVGMSYFRHSVCTMTMHKARENTLKQDLFVMREAIDDYTRDKSRAPKSLQQLVEQGYVKAIPIDPITGTQEWNLTSIRNCSSSAEPRKATGICDVHSASTRLAEDHSAYSDW